jgi:putative addiction module component (TIGR02574 family)
VSVAIKGSKKRGVKMKPEEIKIEIDRLALSEKLLLVEDVWDSIAISNSELPMPEWQKKELDRRYQEYKRGKLDLHDWESTHAELRGKYK